MRVTAVLTPDDRVGYVAYNPETGTASQGESIETALANLREAVELYLEEASIPEPRPAIVTMLDVAVA